MWISAAAEKIILPRKGVLLSAAYNIMYYFIVGVLLFSGTSKIIDPLPTVETLKAAFKFSDEIKQFIAGAISITEMVIKRIMFIKSKRKFTSITVLVVAQRDFGKLNGLSYA